MSPLIIGTVGVGLLLLAFLLNLMKRLSENSRAYLLMNFLGAGMAGWFAFDGDIWPFVVLEAAWALTALVRLIVAMKNPRPTTGG